MGVSALALQASGKKQSINSSMDVRLLLGASSKSEMSEQVMSKQTQRINKRAQRKKHWTNY